MSKHTHQSTGLNDALPGPEPVQVSRGVGRDSRTHSIGAVTESGGKRNPQDQLGAKVSSGFQLADQSFKNPPPPAARNGNPGHKNKPGA